MTASLKKLSLPQSILLHDDDSFSRDLLNQFDKRRSRLHYELGLLSKEPSPEPIMVVHEPTTDIEPIQLDDVEVEIDKKTKRHSSASDLLFRIKSKFNLFRHKSHEASSDSLKQKKLLMKTTISIPSASSNHQHTSPYVPTIPVITQYPPKPLVYSPVEPAPMPQEQQQPLLHRISMPLLRAYNDSQSLSRNKSFASFRRKSEPHEKKRKYRK